MDLKSEHLPNALDRIAAWRCDPFSVQKCPACDVAGIEIIDRSARPYSEWYALKCGACGLDAALHIPLPGPAGY
ncbi:MAG: hypothetical protein QM780_01300 [Hyphomicrobium sp.]|uniref:hypothetical protein n=1 Tax=Hyphomicrobium sp. TaxID=82 RepID=UPI0039E71AE2